MENRLCAHTQYLYGYTYTYKCVCLVEEGEALWKEYSARTQMYRGDLEKSTCLLPLVYKPSEAG